MERTTDLLIFEEEDLLGIKDTSSNICLKTYYELEDELEDVKNNLKKLQKQVETILQTPKQICYIYSFNSKMEIIDVNCKSITINWRNSVDVIFDIDNVQLKHSHSDHNNFEKFLQTFKNIKDINMNISFPTSTHQYNFVLEYLKLIKTIIKFNNEIKIEIIISTLGFTIEWLEDILEDIIIENIKLINITYLNRVDVNNTKIIKGIIKSLDKKITDKIILKVKEELLPGNGGMQLGY